MPGLPVPVDMEAMTAAWPAARIIKDPLGLVDDMFAIQPTTAHTTDWHLPTFIQQQLSTPTTTIPQLTLTPTTPPTPTPSHATLVRLRCLVQNTHSSDYYLAAYRTVGGGWRTARYRDCVGVGDGEGGVEDGSVVTMERMDVTVVELTGENEWVKRALSNKSSEHQQQQRGSDGQQRSARKRQLREEEEEEDSTSMEQDADGDVQPADAAVTDDNTVDPSKKVKAVQETSTTTTNATPVSTASCIVTLYGSHCHSLRVGDVVDVVGIYSITPHLLQDDDELGHNAIHSSHHVHCLTLQRCSPPFVHLPPPRSLSAARSSLLAHLTAVCGGDSVAASLLLLCFISRVQKRSPDGGVMGKLILELTRSTSTFAQRLTTLCTQLLTHSITLPITTTTLSTTTQPLNPHKDYTTNQLTHSPLLLPPTAALLLDATALAPGELSAVGVRNVGVLNRLLEEQVLVHAFAYCEVAVCVDVCGVVLSGGVGKGLLFAHVSLPWVADADSEGAGAMDVASEVEWDVWRQYMAAVNGEAVRFHVSESVGEMVERVFVERRRGGGEAVQAEWLHRVLLVARLVVRSYGEEELSEARLMEAVQLLDEVERRTQAQAATVASS